MTTGGPATRHPAPPNKPGRRTSDPAAAPSTPPPTDPTPTPHTTGPQGTRPDGELTQTQRIMRARLAAMATPRDTDDAELAALRAVLRDQRLMTQVMATVDQWPEPDEQQRETIAVMLNPRQTNPRRHTNG